MREKNRKYTWPYECYGNNRDIRKPRDGYESVYSENIRIASIFRMIKKVNKFKTFEKGYVVFDKAFDINNRRLLFHINITAYVKIEFLDTALKRHNEFMWWTKIN